MSTKTQSDYVREYLARKGRRVARAAQHAAPCRTVNYNGTQFIVKVADRSRGFRSDYTPVKTYFILVYKDGQLVNGYTKTEKAWQQAEREIDKLLSQ